MHQIVVYIPDTHIDVVKNAMFLAGAGRVGNYDCCSWQTLGQGQFRPLKNSVPFVGSLNKLELVAEYRVEMVCQDELVHQVLRAIKIAHPYEDPAFSSWPLDVDVLD